MEDNYVFNREELDALAVSQRSKRTGRQNPAEDIVLSKFRTYIPDLKKCSGMKHAMDLYSVIYRTRIEVKAKINNVFGIDVKFLYDAERHPEDKVFIFINMIRTSKPMISFSYGKFFIIDGYNLKESQLEMIMNTITYLTDSSSTFYIPIQRCMEKMYGNNEMNANIRAIMKHIGVSPEPIEETSKVLEENEVSNNEETNVSSPESVEEDEVTKNISSHESIPDTASLLTDNIEVNENSISGGSDTRQYGFDYDWAAELKSYEEMAKNEQFSSRIEVIDYLLECCRETIENWYVPYELFCNSVCSICVTHNPRIDIGRSIDIGRDVKATTTSQKFNWYCKKWGNKEVGRWVISKSASLTGALNVPRNGMRDGNLVRMANQINRINIASIPLKNVEFIPCTIEESRFDGLKLLSGLDELISIHKAYYQQFHSKPSSHGYLAFDGETKKIVNLGYQLSVLRAKRNYGLAIYNFIITHIYKIIETKDMSVSMNVILQSIDEAVRDRTSFSEKRFSIYSGIRTDNTTLFAILYEVRYMRRDGSELVRYLIMNKNKLESKLREHKQTICDYSLHAQTRSNGHIVLCYNIEDL